jgi:hypothetical protein
MHTPHMCTNFKDKYILKNTKKYFLNDFFMRKIQTLNNTYVTIILILLNTGTDTITTPPTDEKNNKCRN